MPSAWPDGWTATWPTARGTWHSSERWTPCAICGTWPPFKPCSTACGGASRSYLWLAVTDLQGRVVAATDGSLVGNDISAYYDLRDQLRGRATSLSDPLRVVRPGDPDPPPMSLPPRQINISRPIRAADGAVVGVIVAQLSWDWMRDSLRGLLSPDEDGGRNRQTLVVSASDYVLIGPPDMVGTRLMLADISRARAGIYGWDSAEWPDGTLYITGVNFAAGEGQFPGAGSIPMRWTVLVREAGAHRLRPGAPTGHAGRGHRLGNDGVVRRAGLGDCRRHHAAATPDRRRRRPPAPGRDTWSCPACVVPARWRRCPPRCAPWWRR